MRVIYRLWQGVRSLGARPSPSEERFAADMLSPQELALYDALSAGDRRHAACVLCTLLREGLCQKELATAALLHDVGKAGGRLSLAHRSLSVILAALWPGLLTWLAVRDPRSWRYPFYVYLHHGEIGAERCAAAGCEALTIYLVRYHDVLATPAAPAAPRDWYTALNALRSADGRC